MKNKLLTLIFFSLLLLSSCTKEYYTEIVEPPEETPDQVFIKNFSFKSENNSIVLIDDIDCTVNENTIFARIPHVAKSKILVPSFEVGEGVKLLNASTGEEIVSDVTLIDFSKPLTVKAIVEEQEKIYEIGVSAYTGLPMVFINTGRGGPINQKHTYIEATFHMYDNYSITKSSNLIEEKIGIRGRGNSTWGMPKKPYKIKFDKKISLFGLPKNKHWVLLADYSDKTQLRNKTAFYMSSISDLAWGPSGKHVEVFINEDYAGTYLLCEQVREDEGRVEVGENGYLLEIDDKAGLDPEDVFFTSSKKKIVIKAPELKTGDEKYKWIVNYYTEFEDALFNPNTKRKIYDYVDLTSFVDWYIINEIVKNNDAIDYSSCYLNLVPGGLIKRGPVWDFDLAFGNVEYNKNEDPTGFWVSKSDIYASLFNDPIFVEAVKKRFQYYNSRRSDIFAFINNNASDLKWAMVENNARWNHLYQYQWPNNAIWGAYNSEVTYLKEWLDTRFNWLEKAFNEM